MATSAILGWRKINKSIVDENDLLDITQNTHSALQDLSLKGGPSPF